MNFFGSLQMFGKQLLFVYLLNAQWSAIRLWMPSDRVGRRLYPGSSHPGSLHPSKSAGRLAHNYYSFIQACSTLWFAESSHLPFRSCRSNSSTVLRGLQRHMATLCTMWASSIDRQAQNAASSLHLRFIFVSFMLHLYRFISIAIVRPARLAIFSYLVSCTEIFQPL